MDHLTDIAIQISFGLYEIYARLAVLFTYLFPSVTQYLVTLIAKKLFGVTVNGPEPTDIQILKPGKFYPRVAAYFGYGLASGYVNEEWTVKDLKGAAIKCVGSKQLPKVLHPLRHIFVLFNLQTRKKAWTVGKEHYDLGNDIYEAMLDENLQYTCGYWRDAQNLNEAQVAKMNLIAQKLKLEPGMRVLDIGCGFGTLGCHLAKNYGVSVVGCTVSEEQYKYGQKRSEGLSIELRLCDYRDINEKFDRVVSVGMFEHVGPKNYKTFLGVVDQCLTDDGIFLLQCIGNNGSTFPSFDMWIHKYIFPNSQIPNAIQIIGAAGDKWVIEDWQNFGFDYSRTLAAWEHNFEEAWPRLQPKYGDRFYRKWKLFLNAAQVLFISRSMQLWQIVMTKHGMENGYPYIR